MAPYYLVGQAFFRFLAKPSCAHIGAGLLNHPVQSTKTASFSVVTLWYKVSKCLKTEDQL